MPIETKDDAIKRFKFKVNGTLGIFNIYGMGVHITEVTDAVLTYALELHKQLVNIHLEEINGKRVRKGIPEE